MNDNLGVEGNRENIWACALYVVSLIFIFPLSNIILPLLIWLCKKKHSEFINAHGKNVVNFQLSLMCFMLAVALLLLLTFGVVNLLFPGFGLTVLTLSVIIYGFLIAIDFILMLSAAIFAYKNKLCPIRYCYKFIKS